MPYADVASLPAAVRSKLKGKRRRQWMHVWNSEYKRHGNESRAFASAWSAAQKLRKSQMNTDFNLFLPLSKVERQPDGSVTVSGYASTPALDLDNEIVALAAVKKALPGYWEWRNIREMHQPSAVGVGKEANVDDRGLFLTAKITDPTAAQKCIDEVYKGFSIGGKKLAKNGNTITEIELVEISIVDRPANPECRIEVAKKFKERRPEAGGYLVKAISGRTPTAKALSKMAQAVELLAKDGPPAARDGFSLPAKKAEGSHTHEIECETGPPVEKTDLGAKCAAHDKENCPICTEKREVKTEERESLASQGKALPGGGFPIKNKEDLGNARQAIGRAKNPSKAKALIRRRAKELGVKLPSTWSKKMARKLIKRASEVVQYELVDSALPSFLTLSADDGTRTVEGLEKSGHELPPGLELVPKPRRDGRDAEFLNLERAMETKQDDDLEKMLTELAKAGRPPSRMQRMQIARANMKKAKNTMKECSVALKAAHAMHKEAYLSKLAKKGKPDSDGDFDHETAMKYLQKAYGDLSTLKTFVKAADMNIKKAAGGRVGQSEQAVETGNEFYQVPQGVSTRSQSEMNTLGPAGGPSGSAPIDWGFETGPKKAAKAAYSATEVEALTRAASAEAKVELLEKMPATPSGGRKPYLFDTTKFALGNDSDSTSLFKDVNPTALNSDDEQIRKAAVGRVIGNMITLGHGRPVFDPEFHGTAGAK
jgi:hypothetical protein